VSEKGVWSKLTTSQIFFPAKSGRAPDVIRSAARGDAGNLRGPSVHAFDIFIYGAPPLAPLLFPNLMVLGIIALWQLRVRSRPE
jgi:hypothetical protein